MAAAATARRAGRLRRDVIGLEPQRGGGADEVGSDHGSGRDGARLLVVERRTGPRGARVAILEIEEPEHAGRHGRGRADAEGDVGHQLEALALALEVLLVAGELA